MAQGFAEMYRGRTFSVHLRVLCVSMMKTGAWFDKLTMNGLGNGLTAPLILSLSKDGLKEELPDTSYRVVVRQAHHERTLFGERILFLTPNLQSSWLWPGNRNINRSFLNPSFRRKPESRKSSRKRMSRLPRVLDSGFHRNDGCLGCHSPGCPD